MKIEAVAVNHNTSAYMELMLRSLYAQHPGLDLSLTLYDNASEDDRSALWAYAARQGVPVLPSGFTTHTAHNSHGELLRRFVLEHPHCSHYLFLDADVVFLEPGTIDSLLAELETDPTAFGIGPSLSWDGISELDPELLRSNPAIYENRLHPCCALLRNTPLLRRVVEAVGFSSVKYLWAEREEYLDTMQLFTTVMRTHGLRHIRSRKKIIHFFCVSYDWDPPEFRAEKARRRDRLLAEYRNDRSVE